MDPLSSLLSFPASQKLERGLLHTPYEIAQQPQTWVRTFEVLQSRQQEIQGFLNACGIGAPLKDRPIVFLIGAGTSDYIGQSLHPLLREKWETEVIPVASTSLLTDFANYVVPGQRYLWISFSRSGDSPEGIAVLERALAEYPQIAHLLITCNASGKMSRAVEGQPNSLTLVLDDKTNDRGLAMTSSFTNMVLAGQILAHAANAGAYEPVVQALAAAGDSLLPQAATLASELVKRDFSRACFVGSGALAGAARESALKMLELTAGRILTMSESTLGLRHGPMAALNQETLFVAFVSNDSQRRNYELSLLREIGSKELVRTRVAVATHPAGLETEAEHVLSPQAAGEIPDYCRPVLDVTFGQLLGLFASIHCGLKPDVPSPNGAISRVVPSLGIS